ncbi:hypothetical protein RUM43_000145 [Polyplax serrata]|uniref:Uncharacterized protein n=1 Tax=Polyplax serrata TaxID=468196 RepID=A0AAN8SDJ5_POLSC
MGRYYNDSGKENNQCGSEVEKNKNQGRHNNAKREEKRHETVVKGRPQCFTLRERRETEAEEKEKGGKREMQKVFTEKNEINKVLLQKWPLLWKSRNSFHPPLSPL